MSAADSPFLAALRERALLCDGAMGTLLRERGLSADACLEEANVDHASLVRQIHAEYIQAGADVVQTNTFGANRVRLGAYGLEKRVGELNRRAVELAREAIVLGGRPVFCAGDIGPLDQEMPEDEALEVFGEQMAALAKAGVDLFVIETFTSVREAEIAVRAARQVAPHVPTVAEISFDGRRRSAEGLTALEAARALRAAGADVVGANCGEGPAQVLRLVREMADEPGLTLAAQPSAGRPLLVHRRVVYAATAEFMGDYARRLVRAGARLVGGCCGTSPRHTGAMRRAIDGPAGARIAVAPEIAPEMKPATPRTLRQKLAAGRFVVSVEIDPPKGTSVRRATEAASLMRECGADCINVGDSPMAEVRMSAIATASLLRERAGVETIVHFATRDRNLMALQADLMGAHALGIRNVLCIKGDPHALGRYTNAAAVWDVNALGLMRILKGLNAGHDALDNPVRPPTRFFVAAAVNPSAADVKAEVRLVRRKVEAGADFLMSQAVFDATALERFLDALGPPPVPIMVGVWPLHTLKQASFLNERVLPIPSTVLTHMEKAGDDGEKWGREMAQALLERVVPLVQGVYFIPSFGRFAGLAELVTVARTLGDGR